MNVNEDLDI